LNLSCGLQHAAQPARIVTRAVRALDTWPVLALY
jgi:hypothetical protein